MLRLARWGITIAPLFGLSVMQAGVSDYRYRGCAVGKWVEAVAKLMDEFPRGVIGLLYLVVVAAVSLVVFVAAYAHWEWREAVENGEDNRG